MAAPRKYPEKLRERAIRMAVDLRRDPATRSGALRCVGEQLGINPETFRNWVGQAEIDERRRPGVTTVEAQRIAELEREICELRRASEILRTAPAFFAAAELDASGMSTAVLVDYIDHHRGQFGVEPICEVLRGAGMQIAARTYYAAKTRPPSARTITYSQQLG